MGSSPKRLSFSSNNMTCTKVQTINLTVERQTQTETRVPGWKQLYFCLGKIILLYGVQYEEQFNWYYSFFHNTINKFYLIISSTPMTFIHQSFFFSYTYKIFSAEEYVLSIVLINTRYDLNNMENFTTLN